jgi:hypothetical protein
MAKFIFDPGVLRRGFRLAKTVKPETGEGTSQKGDFHLLFTEDELIIFANDKRRFARVQVKPQSRVDVPSGYRSNEFYLMSDRMALFDSDLDTIQVSVNDKSISISASGNGESRKATLKERSTGARRSPIPDRPSLAPAARLNAKSFADLLRHVSCSALIKETKTDESRRLNQVHFYADHGCAVSNARFYGSVGFLPGLALDLSIVADDIPLVRAFCSSVTSDEIEISQDDNRLYITDVASGSILGLVRLAAQKPALSLLDSPGFATELTADKARLQKSLEWALLNIEGTQRMNFSTISDGDGTRIQLGNKGHELSTFPAKFVKGTTLCADFPVKFFSSIVDSMEDGELTLRYDHPTAPTLLEISQAAESGPIHAIHYLLSMHSHSE